MLPQRVLAQLGWTEGVELEIDEYPASVEIRTKASGDQSRAAVAALLARLRSINPYRGPQITDQAMHEAVLEFAAEKFSAR